jgi:hypothetical protein
MSARRVCAVEGPRIRLATIAITNATPFSVPSPSIATSRTCSLEIWSLASTRSSCPP